jgi:hypothetical protein
VGAMWVRIAGGRTRLSLLNRHSVDWSVNSFMMLPYLGQSNDRIKKKVISYDRIIYFVAGVGWR